MTANTATLETAAVRSSRGALFLGFGTVLRKEITEWLRGRRAAVVAVVSIISVVFTTLVPFVARATGQASSGPPLSMDPTANVLYGWAGQTIPLIALVATMGLLSVERDRGTLAWNLSNPVSRTSVVAAKFVAAFVALACLTIIVPLVVSVGVATIAYGGLPNLATVMSFGLLYLTVPAFWVGLTIALGTFIKGAAGIVGVGFAVMFVPSLLAAFLPIAADLSPTSISAWALATATGGSASVLTLAAWIVSVAAFAIFGKIAFEHQEF